MFTAAAVREIPLLFYTHTVVSRLLGVSLMACVEYLVSFDIELLVISV